MPLLERSGEGLERRIMTMLIMPKVCDECLLSTRKIVSDSRRDELLDSCKESGRAFQCHKATIAGETRVCRAFFDQNHSLVVRLAKLFGRWEEKALPRNMEEKMECWCCHGSGKWLDEKGGYTIFLICPTCDGTGEIPIPTGTTDDF